MSGNCPPSIESKDAARVSTQKLRLDLLRQVHRLHLLDTLLPGQLREVGSKEHLVFPIGFEIMHQLWGIVTWCIGRGVDEDVLVLPGHPNHFIRPGIPNVTRHNPQFGKGQSHLIEIGNRTARFGRHERARMTCLGAERNAQLDTCDVEGKIELVIGGRFHSQGTTRNALNPKSLTARSNSWTASTGFSRLTAATPTKRWGNWRTNSAIVSLLMTHVPGRCQAQSITRSTPAWSISSTSCAALRSWPSRCADPDFSKTCTTSGSKLPFKTGCAHASMICLLEAFAMCMPPFGINKAWHPLIRQGCRGRSPLPEREVSSPHSLLSERATGPPEEYEWISDKAMSFTSIEERGHKRNVAG